MVDYPLGDARVLLRYASCMRTGNLCLSFIVTCLLAAGNLVAQQPVTTPSTTARDTLLVGSLAHEPLRMTLPELQAMPHITVTVHNSHTNVYETYSGVRLADLLSKVGAPLGSELHGKALANYIVATGADGYPSVLALAEVDPSFHPGDVRRG